jgi:hypothetical protein
VRGVGEQRQGSGEDAHHHLGDHEERDQTKGGEQRSLIGVGVGWVRMWRIEASGC